MTGKDRLVQDWLSQHFPTGHRAGAETQVGPRPEYPEHPDGDHHHEDHHDDEHHDDTDRPVENGSLSTTANVAASGDALIDGLISGVKWNGSISYGFTTSASQYQTGYDTDANNNGISAQNEGFSAFTIAQMSVIHAALNADSGSAASSFLSVEGFTNLNITQVAGSNAGTATIRLANSDDASTAYAYYPNDSIYGGDSFFGNRYDGTSFTLKAPEAGNYAWHTAIHEMGHSLGLKHGHTSGFGNAALPAQFDSIEFSVMTYRSYVGDPLDGGYSYELWGAPQTFMIADIAALQHMYGADFTANAGDSVYSWNPLTGESLVNGQVAIDPGGNRIFSTIWDGGGIDTYDMSNYTDASLIDLRPGQHSITSVTQLANLNAYSNAPIYARGNVFNALQFNGDERSLIENAIGGSGDDTMIGNQAVNSLIGGGGNNILNGLTGADFMAGGTGNDTYYVDNAGDTISEIAGQGTNDRVATSVSYALASGADIELFTTTSTGATTNLKLTGNALAQRIIGNAGDNVLSDGGFGGNDTLQGLGGNDTYIVNNSGAIIREVAGEGTRDRVATSVDFTLASDDDIELFTTTSTGATTDLKLTGNALAQRIIGNAGDNVLSDGGFGGNDTLQGLGGNDTYIVNNSGAIIREVAGEGTRDRVATSVDFTLASDDDIELFTTTSTGATTDLKLTGNALAQRIIGNAGDNVLSDGGFGGNDTLQGLGGNDTYIVNNSGAIIREVAGEGTRDRVATSVDFTLASDDDIELFTTTSTGATTSLNLTGNALAQTIIGNAGNNFLNGGGAGGADIMRGLAGDDKYRVYNSDDVVLETAGQGTDRVYTSVDYQLGAGASIELFTTNSGAGTADIDMTGNELSQTIIGNAGNNFLNGGGAGGADVLRGLSGDDKYRVYNSDDVVLENAGQGTDRVYTSVDYQLGAGASIELFTTNSGAGTADIDMTGNELAQTIIGNAGDNVIDGGAGNDTLRGLGGDDTFAFASPLGFDNVDRIVDYSVADDQIRLDSSIFSEIFQSAGTMLSRYFEANTAGMATDANDRIIYDTNNGQLYYDADGTGSASRVQFAELDADLALTFNDFEIV